jgi:hypothetical protein
MFMPSAPYGLDVINSNGAQNLAQIRLHVIPGFPRLFTENSTGCKQSLLASSRCPCPPFVYDGQMTAKQEEIPKLPTISPE